jgi:hypothetical protein
MPLFSKKKKKHHYRSSVLEKSFLVILIESKFSSLKVGHLLKLLSGKGKPLLLIFLSLPFCQPIMLPGLSTPFGIAILMIGLKISFGGKVWLFKSLAEKKISGKTLHKIASKGLWLTRKIKRFIHPRLVWLSRSAPMIVINGILIAILGFVLALPLPIPFSNIIIAWPILLISIGLAEDDGLFILTAYAGIAACIVFFTMALPKWIHH